MTAICRASLWAVLCGCVLAVMPVAAWATLPADTAPRVSLDGQALVDLANDESVRVEFDANTAVAKLPSGPVRYRRFRVANGTGKVRLSVRVLAVKHDSEPRFTVFSPQVVLLDADGRIGRIVPLDHMQLDIRPFRHTRLSGCLIVGNLHSFLLAAYPKRLGELYQFNAKRGGGGLPDRGFYRNSSPLHVYLTWADAGPVEIELSAAPEHGSSCRRVPDIQSSASG